MKPEDNNIEQLVREEVKKQFQVRDAFIYKQIGDTPTDNLQLVPKKYVNLNGAVASRPKSSVASIGQRYFSTDTNIPMTYSSAGWRNGVGSIVAQNN